jgi:hypothetical protein
MKKTTLITLTLLILILSACSSAANGRDPTLASQNGATTGELPAATQLILGTFKLDETENAVTTEQASELLPLWQTLQVLSESDTAAAQETEALITQIQETMTAAQMQAITDMNLSREDMMTVMQEQGMAMGAGPTTSSNGTTQNGNSSNNSGNNFGAGGGMPPPDERGVPGGSPGFSAGGQGQNLSADQIATAQSARQAGGGTMIPVPLINAVIEYLQKKAGS